MKRDRGQRSASSEGGRITWPPLRWAPGGVDLQGWEGLVTGLFSSLTIMQASGTRPVVRERVHPSQLVPVARPCQLVLRWANVCMPVSLRASGLFTASHHV